MRSRPSPWCSLLMPLLMYPGMCAADGLPLADIHLHWKWNQKEVTRPAEAVRILAEQDVGLAVVSGTPPELALELQALAPDTVLPIYGIYRIPGEWWSWWGRGRRCWRWRVAA